MSSWDSDKTIIGAKTTGSEWNTMVSYIKDSRSRANHTGTQSSSTISDFNTAVNTNISNFTGAFVNLISTASLAPTSDYHIANKKYVDDSISGFILDLSNFTTTDLVEGTNLYYTDARVSANADVSANTSARHSAVTIGTANGLSIAGQELSMTTASGSTTGALTSSDWITFNNKVNKSGDTLTGRLILHNAFTDNLSPLNIPNVGTTDPTSLSDGDVWQRSNTLYARLNGTTRTLIHSGNPTTLAGDVSQAEAEAGTSTTRRFWTAQRVSQAIAALSPVRVVSTGLTLTSGTITANPAEINHNSLQNTHNLTTDIDHNQLTNYNITQHRVINDSTTTTTNLWSGSKINTELGLKANDNDVVKLSGNQTVAGIKTFSSFPLTPSSAPNNNYEVANKKYVDDQIVAAGSGTVTSVSAGNGLNFSTITTTGAVTLGTPSTITPSTINEVTSTSHTHAITGVELPLTFSTGLTRSTNTITTNDTQINHNNLQNTHVQYVGNVDTASPYTTFILICQLNVTSNRDFSGFFHGSRTSGNTSSATIQLLTSGTNAVNNVSYVLNRLSTQTPNIRMVSLTYDSNSWLAIEINTSQHNVFDTSGIWASWVYKQSNVQLQTINFSQATDVQAYTSFHTPEFSTSARINAPSYFVNGVQKDTVWDAKQDALGFTPLNVAGGTLTGRLILHNAFTSNLAPLNLPNVGTTDPSSLSNGDIWQRSNLIYARLDGSTRTLYHTGNLGTVSQAEAEAGTATTVRAWTAQRVSQAIVALAPPANKTNYRLLNADTTLATTDGVVGVTGARIITTPSTENSGQIITIKNLGTDTITVRPTSTHTIDGSTDDRLLTSQYSFIQIVRITSTGWAIIGGGTYIS
jgi:hypothetical protein